MQITINNYNLQNLETFSQILKKDENALTNLDYDEFWDGVDIDSE